MKTVLRALALLPMLLAAPAAFATDPPYTLSLPGVEARFPFPDGFCEAKGVYVQQAAASQGFDHVNKTLVSYYLCADMEKTAPPTMWGNVKTPLALLDKPHVSRKATLDYFRTKVDPTYLDRLMKTVTASANRDMHDQLGGASISLDVQPLLVDDNAAYIGGKVAINDPDGPQIFISAVYATTVVKDRLFIIYLYKPFESPADIKLLLDTLRAQAAAFVVANGG